VIMSRSVVTASAARLRQLARALIRARMHDLRLMRDRPISVHLGSYASAPGALCPILDSHSGLCAGRHLKFDN
jgi:hypothetical protein